MVNTDIDKRTRGLIFYEDIYGLVKKLLLDNPSYNNSYGFSATSKELIDDIRVRANCILERMRTEKYLLEGLDD